MASIDFYNKQKGYTMHKPHLYNMNAAEMLDLTIAIYKKSFVQQLIITGIMMAVGFVLLFVLVFALVMVGIVAYANAAWGGFTAGGVVLAVLGALFIIVGLSAFTTVQYAAGMVVAKQAYWGEKLSVVKAFSVALHGIFRLITAALAVVIAYIPAIAVILGASAMLLSLLFADWYTAMPAALTAMMDNPLWVLAVVLAFMLLCLLFMALLLLTDTFACLAVPVSLFERRWFFGAFGKSVRLVKRDYFKVFGMLILAFLMLSALSLSLSGLFDIITVAASYAMETAGTDAMIIAMVMLYVAGSVVSFTIALLMAPVPVIFSTVLYMNQKMKHEGLDIEIGLGRLNEELEKGKAS